MVYRPPRKKTGAQFKPYQMAAKPGRVRKAVEPTPKKELSPYVRRHYRRLAAMRRREARKKGFDDLMDFLKVVKPPKAWWRRIISRLEGKPGVRDPRRLAGWVWYHHKRNSRAKKALALLKSSANPSRHGEWLPYQPEGRPHKPKNISKGSQGFPRIAAFPRTSGLSRRPALPRPPKVGLTSTPKTGIGAPRLRRTAPSPVAKAIDILAEARGTSILDALEVLGAEMDYIIGRPARGEYQHRVWNEKDLFYTPEIFNTERIQRAFDLLPSFGSTGQR